MYQGDLNTSDIIDIKFATVAASTGLPTTLSGTPVISVYKDNSTTESTSGVTLTVDFDARTGLNNVRVDTSSDGTFYAAGSNFQVIITTGTVGGTSAVGYVVGSFSIQKRSGLRPATAGNTIAVDASGRVDIGKWLGSTPNGTVQGYIKAVISFGSSSAQAGAAGSITLDAGSTSTTDLFKGSIVVLVSGTGANQARLITAYNGSTKIASTSPNWATNPDNTSVYIIVPGGGADVQSWLSNPVPATNINGVPITDLSYTKGTASAGAAGSVRADSVTAAVTVGVNNDKTSYRLATEIRNNTAQAGAATSITLDVSASATDNYYTGDWVVLTGGTGPGQVRMITGYVGSTKVATIAPNWTTNPDATSVFTIMPASGVDVELWRNGVPYPLLGNYLRALPSIVTSSAQAGAAGTITLDAGSVATTDFYKGLLVFISSGTGSGQTRLITAYNSSTKVATVVPNWATNPDSTSGYVILPSGGADVELWLNSGVAGSAGIPNVNTVTNADKTGYALTAGEHTNIAGDTQTGLTAQGLTTTRAGYLDVLNGLIQAIWDKATSALTTVGSIGKLLVDNINATISSRSSYSGADTAGTTTLLSRIASAITITGNKVDINDKTGFSLTQTFPTNFSSLAIDSSGRMVLQPGQVYLKKNTTATISFPMTDSTTHAPKTGLAVTAQRSIDAGALANCTNAVAEISAGLYSLVLSAADTNGTMISFCFTATGADTRFLGVITQP